MNSIPETSSSTADPLDPAQEDLTVGLPSRIAEENYVPPEVTPLDGERVRFCRSCFRNDAHPHVEIPPVVYGFLLILSFGLLLFLKPSRCVCCGRLRWF